MIVVLDTRILLSMDQKLSRVEKQTKNNIYRSKDWGILQSNDIRISDINLIFWTVAGGRG